MPGRLDAVAGRSRTAEQQDGGQAGGDGRSQSPGQRGALRGEMACRAAGHSEGLRHIFSGIAENPGFRTAGTEVGKASGREGAFVPFQSLLDYFFPLSHLPCSF